MYMGTRPVKVLPDLQTNKQIIKIDSSGNEIFKVSGSLSNGYVSSSVPYSSSGGFFQDLKTSTTSSFSTINIITSSSGKYSVDQAFHAVDDAVTLSSFSINQYKKLRYQYTGFFDTNGSADISLPLIQYSLNAFPTSSIDYINVTVLIKENNSWFNDIVAVNITSSGGQIHILIDAPALNSSNEFRLLAINENPDDL